MPTTIFHSLKVLSLMQVAVGLVGVAVLAGTGRSQLGASFAVGAALMLGNILALAWTSWRILEKKPIAWTVIIIVIKYAVLLGSVVLLARKNWFDSLGAGLGVASFLIAVLGAAFITSRTEATKIEKIKQKKKLKRKRNEIGSSSL